MVEKRGLSRGSASSVRRLGVLFCGVLAIVAAGNVAIAAPTDGLVAAYFFNGNANDSSGDGHNGTVYGATLAADRFGNLNSAYNFDGIDDYIIVPYSDAFQLTEFTMAAWVMPTTDLSPGGAATVVGRGDDYDNDRAGGALFVGGTRHAYTEGVAYLYEDNGDNEQCFGTDVYPEIGAWTHLAVTRSADGQLLLYIDGVLTGQWDNTVTPTNRCLQDLIIGGYAWNTSTVEEIRGLFTGVIDDVLIYDRALSGDEIADLAVIPAPAALLLGGIGTGLVSWLRRRKSL